MGNSPAHRTSFGGPGQRVQLQHCGPLDRAKSPVTWASPFRLTRTMSALAVRIGDAGFLVWHGANFNARATSEAGLFTRATTNSSDWRRLR